MRPVVSGSKSGEYLWAGFAHVFRVRALPGTAVKEIEDAISSESAPMTGATAAIAELPQMELPQAMRMDMRCGRPRKREIK
jgi:hypothetical protein